MRYATHDKLLFQVGEAVQIFQDQPELTHQSWILEILFEVRIEFGHEQRVVRRKRGNERGIESQIILGRMTGPAGSAIALEGFVEENLSSLCDKILLR